MSTLKERLHADVVTHMKSGNHTALTTLRNVLGEIATREKSGKTPVELDDAQTTALLQKEAAKRPTPPASTRRRARPDVPPRRSPRPRSSRPTCPSR